MIVIYDPRAWYWIVAGDETQAWSSADRSYVMADDAAYIAWQAAGGTPTRIASEAELWDVIRQAAPDRLPDDQRYVRVSLVRERLEALGLWDEMVGALVNAGGTALLAKVLSLEWGILATDSQARALIAAIGADADAILAP